MVKKKGNSRRNSDELDYEIVKINGVAYKRYCNAEVLETRDDMRVSSFCNPVKAVESIKSVLTEEEVKLFRETVFGYMLDVGNLKWLNAQLISMLIGNHVAPVEEMTVMNEIQFQIGERVVGMKKKDLALITGFEFGRNIPAMSTRCDGELWRRHFSGKTSLDRGDLRQAFESINNRREDMQPFDAVKLALLHVLGNYILGNQKSLKVPTTYINLVDDLDAFNKFPWGDIVWSDLVDKVPKCAAILGEGKSTRVTFPGYVFALQIWGFETFPELNRARVCLKRPETYWPRTLNWSVTSKPSSVVLAEIIFNNPEFQWEEMKPTEEELEETCVAHALEKISSEEASSQPVKKARRKATNGSCKVRKGRVKSRKNKKDDVDENEDPSGEDSEGNKIRQRGIKNILREVRAQGERIEKLERAVTKLCELQVKHASMIKKLLVNAKNGKVAISRRFPLIRKRKEVRDVDIPSFELAPEFNNGSEDDEEQKSEELHEAEHEKSNDKAEESKDRNGTKDEMAASEVQTDWGDGFEEPINTQALVNAVDEILENMTVNNKVNNTSERTEAVDAANIEVPVVQNSEDIQKNGVESAEAERVEVVMTEQPNGEKCDDLQKKDGVEMNDGAFEDVEKRPRRDTKAPNRLSLSGPGNGKRRKKDAAKHELKKVVVRGPLTLDPKQQPSDKLQEIIIDFMYAGLLRNHEKSGVKKYNAKHEMLKLRNMTPLWNDGRLTSKSWYYAIWFQGNWIQDTHIDVILYYLRVKAQEYSLKKKFTTTDCYFTALLKQHHDLIVRKESTLEESIHNKSVVGSILGTNVPYGLPWAECEHVYMPMNIGHHWVLLVLDVGEKRIRIYDSNNRLKTPSRQLSQFLPCLENHLGHLMDWCRVYEERGEQPIGEGKVGWVMESSPQQNDG
ncbi:unnamed protein product, partial [Cuscuta epithymum]